MSNRDTFTSSVLFWRARCDSQIVAAAGLNVTEFWYQYQYAKNVDSCSKRPLSKAGTKCLPKKGTRLHNWGMTVQNFQKNLEVTEIVT